MNGLKKEESIELIWGLKAIGEIINRTERQVHYLASSGAIPVKRVAGRWCADREKLIAFFKGEAA